jgi:DUF218 domain
MGNLYQGRNMDRDHRDTLIHLTSEMVDYLALRETPKACDIIWGLGSNDERVALKAAELYGKKLASLILFSGGNGHRWKELTKTEAQLFKEAALRLSVPESAIIVENKSSHTGENVAFSLRILDESRIPVSSALLITIPPFQRRASLTVRAHRKSIHCVNCPISWGSAEGWEDAFLVHAAQLCVGEMERLQEYPGLGYIDFEPGQIPSRILECGEAAKHLLARTR